MGIQAMWHCAPKPETFKVGHLQCEVRDHDAPPPQLIFGGNLSSDRLSNLIKVT